MRLNIIQIQNDETVFYNLRVIKEHEDLIVFHDTSYGFHLIYLKIKFNLIKNIYFLRNLNFIFPFQKSQLI